MTIGDVLAVIGGLLLLGSAGVGLMLAWRLFLPGTVERAERRLDRDPWRCFGLGLAVLFGAGLPIGVLMIPGPTRWFGWIGLFLLLSLTSLGGAGLASVMGSRWRGQGPEGGLSPLAATVRGAVTLELAVLFPLVGWFVVLPVTLLLGLGAATFGLLRWGPRPQAQPQAPVMGLAEPREPVAA